MTKFKIILRLLVSILSFLAATSIVVSVIYYFADYEFNNKINAYIDSFTLPAMFVFIVIFAGVGVVELLSVIRLSKGTREN